MGKIIRSELSAAQKITLLNSTAIPTIDYVTVNICAEEKRATSLKRFREMDSMIRKVLFEKKLKGRTTSNAGVYLAKKKSINYTEPASTETTFGNLQFGKATCSTMFESGGRNATIEAGMKILTEKKIYYNRTLC